MNDPHVEWLKYAVETAPHISYGTPGPVAGETPNFKFILEQDAGRDVLTLNMKAHYASEGDAWAAARPFLKDWQVWAELHGNLKQLTFRPLDAHVIDRAPVAGVHHARSGSSIGLFLNGASESALVISEYPTPPSRFHFSDDVAVMWNRYVAYRNGNEPLLSVAYFCFSYLCLTGGSRVGAASKYHVEEDLLKQLSTLAATRGDWSEARKAEKDSTATPLTAREREWVEAALKALIERVAAYEADPTSALPEITLAGLPPL